MFKKMLIALGLRSAPSFVKGPLWMWTLFGTVPAIVYTAWKYRSKLEPIAGNVKRVATKELPRLRSGRSTGMQQTAR